MDVYMDVYKTYYFDTKNQRISSATYLRELLYSMFTMLQARVPYVPHPEPKFLTKPTGQRDSVGYQILLTWQEFHEKLLQSLDRENISSWTLEELRIWWDLTRFLHTCLMEFASKNGWATQFKYKENPENLLKQYKICENTFRGDLNYSNSIHPSNNDLFGINPCDLEKLKGIIPIIEGKVLLNSQHDFNHLFGIEECFLEGTRVSQENNEVKNLKKLVKMVQDHIKPLKVLLQN